MNELEVLVNQYKNIDSKLDKISDKVEKLSTETVVQRLDIDHLKAEVVLLKKQQDEILARIDELEDLPNKEKAEKWSTVVNNVLKVLSGLFTTAMLTYIGIKI